MPSRINQLSQILAQQIDRLASELSIHPPVECSEAKANITFPYPHGTDTEPQPFKIVEASNANLAVSNDGTWLVHYSRLWSEDVLTIFNLNERSFLQEINNSSPNDPENIQDDTVISVAFSDDSTHLFVAAPHNFNIFEYENGDEKWFGKWFLKRHEQSPFEYNCCQAVFVRGSNDSVIVTMKDMRNTEISDTQPVYGVKFTMKPDERLTSNNYPIEQVVLRFPTHQYSKRYVIDRSGSPRTSACYELLSTEKENTVFSMDCSLMATIHDGAIHLLQRGNSRQQTGEFPYEPQIKLNLYSIEYFGGMCFNPNADAFCVDGGGEVCVFDILKDGNRLECKGECRFNNPYKAKLHSQTDKCLIFLEEGEDESKIFNLHCMTEQRDALRKQIGITFAGLQPIKGDVLLNIVHLMIYEYGYDGNLWPLIQGWIEHEFSEFFQNP